MSEETKLPAKQEETTTEVVAGFTSGQAFALIQRQAQLLAASDLVPKEFKGNTANCVIALDMANRMGMNPLAIMQNIYIVHGKPGWSSTFIIGAINSTKKFSPLRFEMTGDGDAKTCVAWVMELATGERLESPPVSIGMAKKEGWVDKTGSKWKTMPDLMLRYRAATLFGRLYAPEILMGMRTEDELQDIVDITPERDSLRQNIVERFNISSSTPVNVTPPENPGDQDLLTDEEKEQIRQREIAEAEQSALWGDKDE